MCHHIQEEGGQPGSIPSQDEAELGSAKARLGNGQIEMGSPEPAPADQSQPTASSLAETDSQIGHGSVPGCPVAPDGAAVAHTDVAGTHGDAVLPIHGPPAANRDKAPALETEQQGNSHGTEALKALSVAAASERLQPALDVEMHGPLENGDRAAAHVGMTEEGKAGDVEVAERNGPDSSADERTLKAGASSAAEAGMADIDTKIQQKTELPGMDPSNPEAQSMEQPVQEQMRGSNEDSVDK